MAAAGARIFPWAWFHPNRLTGKKMYLTGDIQLHFNKNVIYLLIRESNKKCFSLSAKDGTKVPIEVIMADDQTPEGFEKRRDISVRPLEKLEPGTAYVLKVSPDLQAKNGMSLGSEAEVNFVTAGTATKAVEPVMAEPKTVDEDTRTTPDAAKETSANTEFPSLIAKKNNVTREKTAETDNQTTAPEAKKQVPAEPAKTTGKPAPKEPDQGQTRPNGTYALLPE